MHLVWQMSLLKKEKKPGGVGKAALSAKKTHKGFGDGLVSVSSAQAGAGEEGWDLKVTLVPSQCSYASPGERLSSQQFWGATLLIAFFAIPLLAANLRGPPGRGGQRHAHDQGGQWGLDGLFLGLLHPPLPH